ncbi:MAG: CotH kinase family protein [Bacteroidaceae bacterium]|nr:CotH kinase family protein [Bacteroidaceae bacterium]
MIVHKACRLFVLFCFSSISILLQAYNSAVDYQLEGKLMYSGSESKALLAFDDDASTYYSTSGSEMQWVGLDLGQPFVITRVGYTPAPGSQGADRAQLSLFEGANSPDFMDAMPLYFISDKPANGTFTTADVNVSRGFRYVRYVGGAGSYCNIAELKFFGHAGEGDDTQFYQITNLPTLSIHVQDNIKPTNRGEDFESRSVLIYDGGTHTQEYPILFRVRGNFSASPENKAYRVKYNDGKSHHMMKDGHNESPTKAKKWVLINSYRDKTLMRNPVAWAMSKRAEKEWTPWSQIVDLVVNGDYRGTYTLADHVSVTKGRIDITEMTESDIDEETITGGYYVEVDNNASREPYWFSSSRGNPISIHEPDDDVMQPEQFQYIKNTWNNMENIVFGSDYTDPENGFRSVIDLESFLRWFLVSEFNGNTDMICQVFMFKDRGDDHFYTGPVWDAELALENDQTTYPANNRYDWTYKVRQTGNWGQFVSRILSDPSAFTRLQEMWAVLRKSGAFNPEDVAADVDSLRLEVRASANLNFIRWPYLNQYISLNPEIPGSWEKEVDRVRDFVRDRVEWMDYMLDYGLHKKNGIYQIASAIDLTEFCRLVNENGETEAKAVLLNDIDMLDYNEYFQPIGTSLNIYAGSFDGKGHAIRNLYISGDDAMGFFGHVGNCTISNIVFDGTCIVEGKDNVSMLVGYAHDDCATISGIENHGVVVALGNTAGAIVGAGNDLSTISITNCCNTGSVVAKSNAAALVGPFAGKMSVTNSYNIGNIMGATEGKEFAFATNSLTIDNCWDYTSTQTNNMTPEQVDNGYLCYQLNYNDNTGGNNWRQNLDNGKEHDPWPVLGRKSGRVYESDGGYTNYNAEAVRYRYYNLVISEIVDGTSGTIQFSEFDILDDTFNEVEDLSIYDGPEGYGGEGYVNATDNNVFTKYCGSFHGNSYFLFDAMDDVAPYGYRIYTANDTGNYSGRNPVSWKLYGSDTQLTDPNDPDWVLLDERISDNTLPAANYTPTDFIIPEPVKSLTLSKQSATLLPSEELQLEVSAENVNIQGLTLQWTTSNNSVANVTGDGLVIATGLGKADIIVYAQEDKSLRDTCTITVVKERVGYRYYQFAIDATAGNIQIQLSELDLLDKDGEEIKPLTLYAYNGKHYGNEVQENLFDDDVHTKYCGPFSPVLYLYIDAGKEVSLSGYRLTTANDTKSNFNRNPVSWSLFGSNSQTENTEDEAWTLLDRRENDNTLKAVNYEPFDFFISYPQPVFVMAQNQTMVYGDTLPDLTFTVDGDGLVGVPTITCDANSSSPVGMYPITITKGTVENKDVIYMAGELTITKAPLTVTTEYAEREEGEENPDFILVYNGWKNGEDESVLQEIPVAITTATKSSSVGEYPVTLSGGKAQNYDFIYVDGILVVTESDAIHTISDNAEAFDVFTVDGKKIRHQVRTLRGLQKGVYIINGKKVAI